MPLNTPPLGYTGQFATLQEAEEGVSQTTIISPYTLQAASTADFSSPPPIGNVAPNTAAFTTLSSTSTTSLATQATATTVNIANGVGGNTVNIENGINTSAQTVNIASGAAGASSTVNLLAGNATAGTQTLNLATGTGGKTVHIADGAGVNAVTLGSTDTTSSTTVQSGSGNLAVTATGGSVNVSGNSLNAPIPVVINLGANSSTGLQVSTAAGTGIGSTFTSSSATKDAIQCITGSIKVPATSVTGATPVVNNVRTGQVGFSDVIANGAFGTLTMTNSIISSTSVIVATASCATASSGVQITAIAPGSGTVAFTLLNAGSASTNTTIFINFWVLN